MSSMITPEGEFMPVKFTAELLPAAPGRPGEFSAAAYVREAALLIMNERLEQAALLVEETRMPIMGAPHLRLIAVGIRALKEPV